MFCLIFVSLGWIDGRSCGRGGWQLQARAGRKSGQPPFLLWQEWPVGPTASPANLMHIGIMCQRMWCLFSNTLVSTGVSLKLHQLPLLGGDGTTTQGQMATQSGRTWRDLSWQWSLLYPVTFRPIKEVVVFASHFGFEAAREEAERLRKELVKVPSMSRAGTVH